MLHIDVETRSTNELKKSGAYRYSEDATTEVLCMALLDGDTGHRSTWVPGQPVPAAFEDSLLVVAAWNASFERLIYTNILEPRHGFPALELWQWYDPSAVARQYGLPSGLGSCAAAVGFAEDLQKSKEGRDVMLKMSKPKPCRGGSTVVEYYDTPELRQQLLDYCIQDTEVEYAIHCYLTNPKESHVRTASEETSPKSSSQGATSNQCQRNAGGHAHPEFNFADSTA